ncbi:MAG: dienelactone hydrolase family protein [Candidatus Tectomicrobia bacterium]|nr:dienelactone hydrolase family protein [Candidatus Tectomicrobia bacterium]
MPEEILSSMVQFQSNGNTIAAFQVRPKAEGTYPAIIVIQEWWGLDDHIKDVASRFAREGYVGFAPNLYARLGGKVTDDSNEAGRLMSELKDDWIVKDLNEAVNYLKSLNSVNKDRIGAIGYCMGGTCTLLLAGHNPDLKAAAAYYGQIVYGGSTEKQPVAPIDLVPRMACPILYIYGEEDQWITMNDVNQLRTALERHGKAHEIKTYPAPHAFFNDSRESYRPDAARDAWETTLRFFARSLKS